MWQVVILLGICLSSLLFSKMGCILSSGLAALCTVYMIFTSWLMILQLATVVIGFALGAAITESPNHSDNRKTAWLWIVAGVIVILWLANKDQLSNQQRMAKSPIQSAPVNQLKNLPIPAHADDTEKQKLDALISNLEIKYPVLNVKSSQYNQRTVDEVLSRQLAYIQQGQSDSNALQMAVDDMVHQNAAASTQNNLPAIPVVNNQAQAVMDAMERKNGHVISGTKEASQYQRALSGDFSAYGSPKCIYKAVMTDDEIARCRR